VQHTTGSSITSPAISRRRPLQGFAGLSLREIAGRAARKGLSLVPGLFDGRDHSFDVTRFGSNSTAASAVRG